MSLIEIPKVSGQFNEIENLKKVLDIMVEYDASDIHIGAKRPIMIEVGQRYYAISEHALGYDEVFKVAALLFRSDTIQALIERREAPDTHYTHKYKGPDDVFPKDYILRANFTPTTVFGRVNLGITGRLAPPEPPAWSKYNYEEEVWEGAQQSDGLIVVSGPTGHGKTQLIAAIIRRMAEELTNEKIIMVEEPIEYDFGPYNSERVIIEQSAVGSNLRSFLEFTRSAVRRRPTKVVVGESRDVETIRSVLNIASTGHLAITTTHANGAAQIVERLLNEFPYDEQSGRLAAILDQIRMLISQRLIKTIDGKVVAVRERLIVTPEVKKMLARADLSNYRQLLRQAVVEHGVCMVPAATKLFEEGVISEQEFNAFKVDFDRSHYEA